MEEQIIEKPAIVKPKKTSPVVVVLILLFVSVLLCCGVSVLLYFIGKNAEKVSNSSIPQFESISTDAYTFYYPKNFTKRTTSDERVTHSYMNYDVSNSNAVVINFWDNMDSEDISICKDTDSTLQLAFAILMEAEVKNITNIKNKDITNESTSGCNISASIVDKDGDSFYITQKYIQKIDNKELYLLAVVGTSEKGTAYQNALSAMELFTVK